MKSSEIIRNTQLKVNEGKATEEEKQALKEKGINKKDKKAYKTALLEYRKEVAEKKALEEANKPIIETEADLLKEIRDLLKANQQESKK